LRSLPPALLSHRLPVLSHTEGFLSPFQGNRLPEGGRFSYGGHGLSGAWHNGGRFLSSALPGGLLPRQCFPALLHGFFHGRKQRRNLPPLKLPSLKSPYRPHAPCRFLHPQRINASPSSVLSGSAPVWFSLCSPPGSPAWRRHPPVSLALSGHTPAPAFSSAGGNPLTRIPTTRTYRTDAPGCFRSGRTAPGYCHGRQMPDCP